MLPAKSAHSDAASPCPGRAAAHQRGEAAASIVAALVAAHFNVPAEAIRSPGQGARRLARARRIAIYLAHVAAGLSITGAGAAFARSRASAIEACRRVETERDGDRALDQLLDDLAEVIGTALSR